MAKIPTSTDATVQLKSEVPAGADAVAVFVHKQTKPGSAPVQAMPKPVSQTWSIASTS